MPMCQRRRAHKCRRFFPGWGNNLEFTHKSSGAFRWCQSKRRAMKRAADDKQTNPFVWSELNAQAEIRQARPLETWGLSRCLQSGKQQFSWISPGTDLSHGNDIVKIGNPTFLRCLSTFSDTNRQNDGR